MKNTSSPITYRDAGVDIDAGNSLVERIKPLAARTHTAGVMGGIGGFGALFELPYDRFERPVLVSATDGVGTKLKLAIESGQHQFIGQDLVAMCANDLIVCGAEPLFFLDYYATGKLDVEVAATVVASIADGCVLAGAALVGGETAEMPGMYQAGDYDLAGFCVGAVEKARIIDGSTVADGDVLIALGSSGPHANGYSLIRKILEQHAVNLNDELAGITFTDHLLAPTRIYVKSVLALIEAVPVKALSHITGGGLLENIPRVLPSNVAAVINKNSWELPIIFKWLQEKAQLNDEEFFRTFNGGVGMVVCVAESDTDQSLASLKASGENAWVLGRVEKSEQAGVRFA